MDNIFPRLLLLDFVVIYPLSVLVTQCYSIDAHSTFVVTIAVIEGSTVVAIPHNETPLFIVTFLVHLLYLPPAPPIQTFFPCLSVQLLTQMANFAALLRFIWS
jgi:hypothetical protein